ncbi:hypothetical protein Poli38472_002665 [Pythium oligandrum]|uniref:Uncharacterized protein n=1 Tax=Pythium oligandrum TaxID=41045 RepID=A0A8K1CIK6_PYTOL|nr:hypothetical protein Poli38472_002665 [Pythium oligandrum]|eukprot:TMW63724.1 hypothetical protein Poli38472_002665 [Pythium oligandrum]
MTTPYWTVHDVERFREQQRWRVRQQQLQSHLQAPAVASWASTSHESESRERPRKVSVLFRQDPKAFVPDALPPLAPELSDGCLMVESPMPHAAYAMFNAFDSAQSPELFAMGNPRPRISVGDNQENDGDDEDIAMMTGDDEDGASETARQRSLWRRRFLRQAELRKSPKLGQVALWDGVKVDLSMFTSKQLLDMPPRSAIQRVPHPFASSNDDEQLQQEELALRAL